MKIISKQIQFYKNGSGRPRGKPKPEEQWHGNFVTHYTIETPEGKITYRTCHFWTFMVCADGVVWFVEKHIPMNEDNPKESVDKLESLMLLV